MIVHFVGLDHAGHAFGPQSDRYAVIARSMDEKIHGLIQAVDADTTVVITSDHAMTNRGGHGGSDAEARQTPLVMLGRGIRPLSGLAVDQVDLTPTLAALMGIPIPAQSTGKVIHQALDISDQEREGLLGLNRDQLLHLLQATYPSRWERRLADAREPVRLERRSCEARIGFFPPPPGKTARPSPRSAGRSTSETGKTACRSWHGWSSVFFSARGSGPLSRQGAGPTNGVTVGAAAAILVATFIGLRVPTVVWP